MRIKGKASKAKKVSTKRAPIYESVSQSSGPAASTSSAISCLSIGNIAAKVAPNPPIAAPVSAEVVELDTHKGKKGNPPTSDDDERIRLDTWLAAYASFNDGQAPERKANAVNKLGCNTGKKVRVNRVLVCNLEPGESWGCCSNTKNKYLKSQADSRGSRGRSHLQLVHDGGTKLTDTDMWTPDLSNEKPVAGFLNWNRPPTLREVFVDHNRKLENSWYEDKETDMDIQGWSLYYEKDAGQTMSDFYRHLNQFETEDFDVNKEAVNDRVYEKESDLSPVSTQKVYPGGATQPAIPMDWAKAHGDPKGYKFPTTWYDRSLECPEYVAWLRDPQKHRDSNHRYATEPKNDDAHYRYYWECKLLEDDDIRYQLWLIERECHNHRYTPKVEIDWKLVHPDRVAAVRSMEYGYKTGNIKADVYRNTLENIYKNSDDLWKRTAATKLEEYLEHTSSMAEPAPAVVKDSREKPLQTLLDEVSNVVDDRVDTVVYQLEDYKPIVLHKDAGEPYNPDTAWMFNWTNDGSYTIPDPTYKVNIIDHRYKPNPQGPSQAPEDTYVPYKDDTFGEFRVVNGLLVPDHIEEVHVTHKVPSMSSMLEETAYDEKRNLYLPVSELSIIDEEDVPIVAEYREDKVHPKPSFIDRTIALFTDV